MGEDRRQLVLDVLEGRPAARVPVGFWWHYYSVPGPLKAVQDRMTGASRVPPEVIWKIVPNNPFRGYASERIRRTNLEDHRRDYLALQPDFVKIMSDGFFSHPSIVDNKISRAADLAKIKPIGADHPWIREQVRLVRELIDFYDGEVLAFYTIFAPIQQLRLFAEYVVKDVAGFQDMLLENKEEVARAAEVIATDTLLLVDALKAETGVDGIFYSAQSAQRPECDRAHHDRYIKPSDRQVLDHINALWRHNILHICGYEHYQNDLEYYASYPASAYNWAVHTEGVSLAEGKEIFDGVVLGGFDNNPGALLDSGTTAQVVAATRQMVVDAGPDRLILGADCTVPTTINLDRINVIRYAAAQAVQ
ncbi:MAG TPA: uroporphyrinogen decarboxylase family protein [Marmoricola sp.]|nr:uroporphyrinogen decarboxylase family protein [Marmoricola sp.]